MLSSSRSKRRFILASVKFLARLQRLDLFEPELGKIEPLDEDVDGAHGIVFGHIVLERRRKQRALSALDPFHEPSHRLPPGQITGESCHLWGFHTAWDR